MAGWLTGYASCSTRSSMCSLVARRIIVTSARMARSSMPASGPGISSDAHSRLSSRLLSAGNLHWRRVCSKPNCYVIAVRNVVRYLHSM